MLRRSRPLGSRPAACSFWGRKNVFTRPGPTTDSGRLPEHALTRIAKGDGLFLKSRYGAGLSSLACITFNGAIVPVVLAFGSGAEEERAGFAPASTADAGIALFRALPLCSATAHIGEQPTGSPHADRGLGPLDETITIEELTRDPYPIYRRLRREAPVLRVKSVGRTFLTKAADTKYVKDNAVLFSSDDPNTPMKRAFLAHTLMRKDHDEHRTERMAMMPALMPKTIESVWAPLYAKLAAAYLDRLPRGEMVDLFPALAGPLAARMLAHAMGVPDASDEDMQRWSQTLIDGAGNFGWTLGLSMRPTSPMRRWTNVSAPTPNVCG